MIAGLLEIGMKQPLHTRVERLSQREDYCRLAYVSDIHLRRNRSKLLCQQILEAAHLAAADALLLGGDLVDTESELLHLRELVAELSSLAPVLAIAGNHDQQVGIAAVGNAVIDGGGRWIQSDTHYLTHGSRIITVSGPEAMPVLDGDFRVLSAHNPRIWATARKQRYDLVLAGHLHGCQLVAYQFRDRLYPGAFFYPYCYLSHQDASTRLVVSRGVSDLLPIRWRCPREIVVCEV